MKLNGNNIITDNDITLTGKHSGETLDVILDNQQEEIDKLKGNVKWIYQNGGVGGNGSSGGGVTGAWSIFATLESTQVKSNNIILNGNGNYNLVVKINKPQGGIFKCNIQYKNKNGTQTPSSVYLSIDNVYTAQYNLLLNTNDQIIITVVDENGETKQANATYITNPYDFQIKYIKTSGQEYYSEDNDIFIEDIQKEGLGIQIDYSIGIDASVQYKYTKFDGTTTDFTPLEFQIGSGNSGLLKVAEDSFFTNDKSGYYSNLITIEITPKNQQPIIITKNLSCNLIPKTLYLKLKTSSGIIYNDQSEPDPYHFSSGNVTFFVQVYQGSNLNRQYKLQTKINNVLDTSNVSTLKERENTEIKYLMQQNGWNKVDFIITSNNGLNTYSVTKYLYIYNSNQDLDFNLYTNCIKRVNHLGTNNQTEECIPIFGNNSFVKMNNTINQKELNWNFTSQQDLSDFIFNVSFEISKAASDNNPIFTLKDEAGIANSDDSNFINIYRTKVTIGKSTSLEIFFPNYEKLLDNDVSNYHLLTIHKRFFKEKGNGNRYFEFNVYIDGKLEATTILNSNPKYTKLEFKQSVYNCNFLDILQYNTTNFKDLLTDSDITKYFYTWVYKFSKQSLVPNFDEILDINRTIQNKFILDSGPNKRMVGVDIDTVRNLAQKTNNAVLLLKVQDTKPFEEAQGTQNFIKWYSEYYKQEMDETSIGTIDVSIEFSKNKSGLTPYSYQNTKFTIDIQGSSTKQNFSKNLELGIKGVGNEDATYLFSPNFIEEGTSGYNEKDIHNSFLPEHSFTLKADVVDSSHCNNNSIGAFINDNTKKFRTGDQGKYKNYIKNCLTGFPCLIFVQTDYIDPITQQNSTNIYYLGIYNFNLGRKSYYNLGYKNTNNLADLGLKTGFGIYQIATYTDNKFTNGLRVAEVQNNDPYWDWSQYDETIISGLNASDPAMYGDFVSNDTGEHIDDRARLVDFNKHIALAGGYIFDKLEKNFGTNEGRYTTSLGQTTGKSEDYYKSINQVPDYRNQYTKYIPTGSTEITYKLKERINSATQSDLTNCILGNVDQGLVPYVDYTSLVEYYTICMAFGLLDSVEKNLNIKSWNDGKTYYIAFYDMDTSFGKDNAGKKVDYFAFSDYWHIISEDNNLVDAVVQRDFQPALTISTESFFDVPSSYLFAIAKYAAVILGDTYKGNMFPLKVWSEFRKETGELRNAEYFMVKYFSGRFANIGPELLNYNYRAKYLPKKDDISYIQNIESFHGSSIYSIQDWLTNRIHTLDIYMGLASNAPSYRYIQAYNKQQNIWYNIGGDTNALFEKELTVQELPTTNPDILIYKDIFSSGGDRKYSKILDVDIKALPKTFLVLSQDSSIKRFYLEDPNKTYHLNFHPDGAKNLKVGGSDRLTYISNLASFYINSTDIYINSLNLANFSFDNAIMSSNAIGKNIYLPNCETIQFSNAYNCTNNADIEQDNFPAVKSIDLSTSKMQTININNVPIVTFLGRNMNSNSLTIQNCEYINNVDLSNSKFATAVSIGRFSQNPVLINMQCQKLTLEGRGQDINIDGNQSLEELVLDNFTNITISNCYKLSNITLRNCTNLNSLTVTNCSSLATSLTINSTDKTIDLRSFTKLKSINFSNTKNFTNIYFASDPKLAPSCFANTNLVTLSGRCYITGSQTFRNCPITSDLSNIFVDSSCTDLSYTFNNIGNYINLENFNKFLNNVSETNNVTNISYLVYGQSGIVYDKTNISEYNKGICNIHLNNFKKVNNAQYVFAKTKVIFLNKFMFKDFGTNNINLNGFFGYQDTDSNSVLYTTIDGLEYIVSKTNNLNIFYEWPYTKSLQVIDNSGNNLESVEVAKLFNSENYNSSKLNFINNFSLVQDDNIFYDYTNLFESDNWSNLRSIDSSFNNIIIDDYKKLKLNKLALNSLTRSFNSLHSDTLINYYDLLNWEYYINNVSNNQFIYADFNFTKYILKEDFDKIWELIYNNQTKILNIYGLFKDTYIVGNNLNLQHIYNYVKTFDNTFNQLRLINSIENINSVEELLLQQTQYLDLNNFIDYFPKVSSFYSAFSNNYIKELPKFNFFNRRTPNISRVYKAEEVEGKWINTGQPINLITYTYNQNINSLENVFSNCKFDKNVFIVNEQVIPETNHLELNGEKLQDTKYFKTISSNEVSEVFPDIYVQNLLNPTTCSYETASFTSTKVNTSITYQNSINIKYFTEGDKDYVGYYCLPPDFFAGVTSTSPANLQNTFRESNIFGSFPISLFNNLTNNNFRGMFYNCHILPTYYNTFNFTYKNNIFIKRKRVYSFIPKNFCYFSLISQGFNFVIRLPNSRISDNVNEEEVSYYYMYLDISFKKIPTQVSQNNLNNNYFLNDGTSPINIMFNTKLVQDSTCGQDGWSLDQVYCDNLFDGGLYYNLGNIFINPSSKPIHSWKILNNPILTFGRYDILSCDFPFSNMPLNKFINYLNGNSSITIYGVPENSKAYYKGNSNNVNIVSNNF